LSCIIHKDETNNFEWLTIFITRFLVFFYM
jgi:hypothetical protein